MSCYETKCPTFVYNHTQDPLSLRVGRIPKANERVVVYQRRVGIKYECNINKSEAFCFVDERRM